MKAKATILFFILFSTAAAAYCQNQVIDSLQKQMRVSPADSTVAMLHYEKAYYYSEKKLVDSFRFFASELKRYGHNHGYPEAVADYYHLMVAECVKKRDYDSALVYGQTELDWALKSGHNKKIANAYNAIGNVYTDIGNGDSAALNLLKGLPYAQKSGNRRLPVNMLYNLSAAYMITKNFTAANEHAKKAYEGAVKIGDEHAIKSSLFNWATMEVNVGRLDTAIIMFNHMIKTAKRENDDLMLMDLLNNLGEVYYQKQDFEKSLAQYNQVAEILKSHNEPEYELYLYGNRGNTLIALNRFQEAEKDLIKATGLAQQQHDNFLLQNIYAFRSSLAEKTRDFKTALFYWKASDSIKQLTASAESKKHIEQLEMRYQTAQKDLAISEQQVDLLNKENAIRKKTAQNVVLLVGCLLLALVLFLAYRNIRSGKRLAERERELHDQKIKELEKKHQLDAMQSILRMQEEERRRLAKDLHDGIGGLLSGVKLGLSSMQENRFLSQENADRVNSVIHQLDRSIEELRRVSHNMMPEALIRFGLKEALENYCENINLSGKLHVRLQTYGLENRMNQDEEISIYRIIQELLNNIIKHAGASNVLIQLTHEDKKFSLTVEDDGKGFDMLNVVSRNSAGIVNIHSRAQFLNGSVDFQTAPGEGTSVTIIGRCRA